MVEVTQLGEDRQRITVVISKGRWWEAGFSPVNFPEGTTVPMTITYAGMELVVPARFAGDRISWQIHPDDGDPFPSGSSVLVDINIPGIPAPLGWLKGTVQRD